ncbi:glycosyltransferase involved in cell wall biosynthesis [Salinibacter ruber]|nr:glycosyltransferase involved in cell wall biosynthesis [Salinibacter ruber]
MAGLWTFVGLPRIDHWVPDAQVIHSVELGYPVATQKPWVVTIHDLGPLTHPEYFSANRPWLQRKAFELASRRADAIIAVSQATANAIANESQVFVNDRVHVIPEGVSNFFFNTDTEMSEESTNKNSCSVTSGSPFFLWSGSMNPRKNLRRVITAFEKIGDSVPEHLVLTGEIGWDSDQEKSLLQESPIASRIHTMGYVTDERLRELYSAATGFVYVSIMEGFGLPILEAMASGCPVITSNKPPMSDVAGSAALLVNPTSVEDIAKTMKSLSSQKTLRKNLSKSGINRASQFKWERSAKKVSELYRQVA